MLINIYFSARVSLWAFLFLTFLKPFHSLYLSTALHPPHFPLALHTTLMPFSLTLLQHYESPFSPHFPLSHSLSPLTLPYLMSPSPSSGDLHPPSGEAAFFVFPSSSPHSLSLLGISISLSHQIYLLLSLPHRPHPCTLPPHFHYISRAIVARYPVLSLTFAPCCVSNTHTQIRVSAFYRKSNIGIEFSIIEPKRPSNV